MCQGITAASKKQMVEALRKFISADENRAPVCMGDSAKNKVVKISYDPCLDHEDTSRSICQRRTR